MASTTRTTRQDFRVAIESRRRDSRARFQFPLPPSQAMRSALEELDIEERGECPEGP